MFSKSSFEFSRKPSAIASKPAPSARGARGAASAVRTISAMSRSAGSVSLYFLMIASKLHRSSPPSLRWNSSAPGLSYGIAPCSFATSRTFSRGTNKKSALESTNFVMSHGHAIRSTFAFSRVTHFMEALLDLNVQSGRTSMYIFTSSPRAKRSQSTSGAWWIYGFRRLGRSRREAHLPREDGPNGPLRLPRSHLRRLPGPTRFHQSCNRNRPDRDRAQQRALHLRHQLRRGSYWPAEDAGLLRAHRLRRGNSALRLDGLVGPGARGYRRKHDRWGGRSRAVPVPRTSDPSADVSLRSPDLGVQRLQPRRIRSGFGWSASRRASEVHRIFAALRRLHGLRTSRSPAVLFLIRKSRTGVRSCETARALSTRPSHRGQTIRPVRGRLVWRLFHRTEHPRLLLLCPIRTGFGRPRRHLLCNPARDRVVICPSGADRAEDRPLTDHGLHARAFERVPHRSGTRPHAVHRRVPTVVSSIVVADGRAHEAILRHVNRGRAGPDRGGRTHEHDTHLVVVGKPVTGGLCFGERLARNTVGGCGGPQVGVRPVNLRELPENPSSGGTRSHGEVKSRA